MKKRWSVFFYLACLGCFASGCLESLEQTVPPESEPQTTASLPCGTPEDAGAPADIVINAQDASIHPTPETSFEAWTYNGDVPGPVLRIPLWETRRVKLVNQSPRPASLHFHGVKYSALDDGSPEHPESMVNPGCAHVYTITAVLPGVWPYHSHQDPRTEMAMGLHGTVVVPSPSEAPADHEFVVFMGQAGLEEEGGEEEEEESEGGSNFFMTLNGGAEGSAKVIELEGENYKVTPGAVAQARVGERVRWRIVNISPDDPHTFHLHGHRWCTQGKLVQADGTCPPESEPTDNIDLQPAQGETVEFIEDNPGDWMFHCHIVDHVVDGMFAMYHVNP